MSVQSSEQINVLVVIDTDYIVGHYPNPSTSPKKPTVVDRDGLYMIFASPRGAGGGQGTSGLDFRAEAGDVASFTGTSISANSDAAVILYDIKLRKGEQVLNPRGRLQKITRQDAVMPDPTKPDGLPPTHQSISYTSYQTEVQQAGKAHFSVYIAVYVLAGDGQTQKLYGYFCWHPSATVRGAE
jgi:nematocidal protein AidA